MQEHKERGNRERTDAPFFSITPRSPPAGKTVRFRPHQVRLATTGVVQLPEHGRSADHVILVTIDDQGADIANLLMPGILDKTGHIPLDGDDVYFELEACGEDP